MNFISAALRQSISPQVGKGFERDEYLNFQKKILDKTGVRLGDYKPEQMQRRLTTIAQRAGCQSYQEYFNAMLHDQKVLADFLNKITINVSELLRNPNRFDDLTGKIMPRLLAERKDEALSIWSAGCSYGAEACTLAMLMEEMSPKIGYDILGTDIDKEILARANACRFTEADMTNISRERRAEHFIQTGDGAYSIAASLRSHVRFECHDLLAEAYPVEQYDLIACRNVVIYFTDQAKERIYRGFFDALRPGGILFVGGTERLADHRSVGFDLVMPFFYRKP